MKLKDLMRLDLFKASKILTGEIGLNNEVESAMVLEAIDIEKWSKENQLILTSFYAFNNVPHSELVEFFEKMRSIGVSGLVVKMNRLITMIPEWLIALCSEFKIPLIKVQQNVSYEKIMLSIYEPILNYQTHLLRTYYDVRQRFTKIERNLASFDQIMQEFYQLIQLSCSLHIPSKGIDIKMGKLPNDFVVVEQKTLENMEFTKNSYEQLHLFSHQESREIIALKTRVSNFYTNDCSLLVYQDSPELNEANLMIIENIIDIIYERLQMEYLIKKDRYTRLNNLADAILQNTPSNIDELNSLLLEAKMDSYPYYQGIAFSSTIHDDPKIRKKILTVLRSLNSQELFFEHHNYLIILYNFEQPEQAITKAQLKKKLHPFFDEQPDLTFAISQVKEKEGLKEILVECLDVLRFNRSFYIDPVVEVSDLGIFRYFMRENQLEQLEELIPEELRQLAKKNPELLETLYTFFQCGRNYKKTAETLFLHSKTIRYRLNKIEQSLSICLTNPIQLVNYEIGTYLLKYKQRSHTHA
ncbi:PucR family transcriptional regulator [Enterococcus sp. LJL51]|uniref:PucR family transcriptional regulator n=1 Tax=Enterococcus sp. LJL51 TaxID=3416656 RepID=UPI003CF4FEF7